MRPVANRAIVVQIIATLAIGLGIREGLRAFMGPSGWPFDLLLSPTPVRICWESVSNVFQSYRLPSTTG
jgi:hypothetical protein